MPSEKELFQLLEKMVTKMDAVNNFLAQKDDQINKLEKRLDSQVQNNIGYFFAGAFFCVVLVIIIGLVLDS